jgi:RHS repeat-associated protein
VLAQKTVYNGTPYQQAFTYDGFNRLKMATETNGWKQVYSYDQWGNRAVLTGTPYYIPNSGLTPQVATDSPASVAAVFPGNRWSGAGYDNGVPNGAGSMTSVSGYAFTYDGEYRLLSSTLGGATTSYTYDGDGRRVMKTAAGGRRTVYVYSALGQVAAEYSDTANPDPGTRYVTIDQLGSTRLVTDATGTCKEAHDYLPFGEEIGSPYRTGCYTTGCTTEKFTAKERDAETGLDFFGARYLSSAQGRFTSADPLLNSAHPWNPQTWNRYAYALNNPLKFTDPTGLYNVVDHCGGDKKCEKQFNKSAAELSKAVDKLTQAVNKMEDSPEKARLQASLKALGTEGDENNVYVSFTAIAGSVAGTTDPTYNRDSGENNFNVNLDPSKNSATNIMAINAAHEGTHVSDFETEQPAQFKGTILSPFSLEYRGYQTSAWAAQALGEPNWTYDQGRNVIWNSRLGSGRSADQHGQGYNEPCRR